MREFFKQELKTLKAKTGLNQYETFSAMTDHDGKNIGAEQITVLINAMAYTCDNFPEIPDDHKQEYIRAAMIRKDHDFTGLYATWVYAVLNAVRGKYFKQEAHQKKESIYDKILLTDEQRKEVDALLDNYKNEIAQGFSKVPKLTPDEIKEEGQERPKKVVHQGPTKEEIEMQDKIRSCAAARYQGADFSKFQTYIVEGYKIFCASQEHAHEIFIEALTVNQL